MKRGLKWAGIVVGGLLGLLVLVGGALYLVGSSRVDRSYEVQTANLTVAADAGTIARGAHLADINGCTDCHGPNLGGQVFADAPPFRIVASNLTRGRGGVGAVYDARSFDRAIRHGVRYDGRALQIMPSAAFHNLADDDAAAIIAYLQQVPPVDNELPATVVRPMGRLLSAFALDPSFEVREASARTTAPTPAPTLEYGQYLTSITCAYCHGPDLRGAQPPNPDSPPAPDLAAAGQWQLDQLKHALRTGQTPGGRQLDPAMMPWTFTSKMNDVELEAIHAHLRTLIDSAPGQTASSN